MEIEPSIDESLAIDLRVGFVRIWVEFFIRCRIERKMTEGMNSLALAREN